MIKVDIDITEHSIIYRVTGHAPKDHKDADRICAAASELDYSLLAVLNAENLCKKMTRGPAAGFMELYMGATEKTVHFVTVIFVGYKLLQEEYGKDVVSIKFKVHGEEFPEDQNIEDFIQSIKAYA